MNDNIYGRCKAFAEMAQNGHLYVLDEGLSAMFVAAAQGGNIEALEILLGAGIRISNQAL